uniref:Polyprotein n=1 Tax=Mesocestoides corti TaxID=53468 RepID=A0A5K3ELX4_MESCO
IDEVAFLKVYKSTVPRLLYAWASNVPDVRYRCVSNWIFCESSTVRETKLNANSLSLCILMACEEGKQPTRERQERGAVYNGRRSQLCGLGWRAPDMWFWHVMGQYILLCCTSLLQPHP